MRPFLRLEKEQKACACEQIISWKSPKVSSFNSTFD